MRERWIDVALMVGLFFVAGIIIWTLFGAPTPQLQSASTPQQGTLPTEPGGVTPIVPGDPLPEDSPAPGSVIPIQPEDSPTNTNADPSQNPELQTEEIIAEAIPVEETPVEETPVTPLPDGALELNRIGFSFVTGGPGACGVVLESWKHVAVSRDILSKYPCGSAITIQLDKPVAGRDSFTAIVGDTMNPVHDLTVNVYVATDEPALQYGVQDGALIP
jgi:3D (Asp-Asp-Asp) domain-containing protein